MGTTVCLREPFFPLGDAGHATLWPPCAICARTWDLSSWLCPLPPAAKGPGVLALHSDRRPASGQSKEAIVEPRPALPFPDGSWASGPRRQHTLMEPHPCPSDTLLPSPPVNQGAHACPAPSAGPRDALWAGRWPTQLRPPRASNLPSSVASLPPVPPCFRPCLPRVPGPSRVRPTQSCSCPGRSQAPVHAPASLGAP